MQADFDAQMARRMAEAADFWHELEGGRAVKLRPFKAGTLMDLRQRAEAAREDLGMAMLRAAAVDWRGFTEADLVPGGGALPVPYGALTWRMWIDAQPERWAELLAALNAGGGARRAYLDDAAKNSPAT